MGAAVAEAPNHTYAFTAAFFEELARAGVRNVTAKSWQEAVE